MMRTMSGWVTAETSTSLPAVSASAPSRRSNPERTEKQTSASPLGGQARTISAVSLRRRKAQRQADNPKSRSCTETSSRWRGYSINVPLGSVGETGRHHQATQVGTSRALAYRALESPQPTEQDGK